MAGWEIMKRKKKYKVGFTCGSFDLTHAGHYLMFEECSKQCDTLVVGLQHDPTLDRPDTKNKPIQSVKERYTQLRSCKYISIIITYKTENDLVKLLKKLKPDVRFVGADWKGKAFTGKHLPIKVIYNSRNHKYSSTALRQKVYLSELEKNKRARG